MSDELAPVLVVPLVPLVVVPYEQFLERRERRRRVVAELGRPAERPVLDPGPPAVAVAMPVDAGGRTDTLGDGTAAPRGLGQRQI